MTDTKTWPHARDDLAAVIASEHMPEVRFNAGIGLYGEYETDAWIKAYNELHTAIKQTLA